MPPEIGRLKALESLNFSHNELKALPPEIQQLTKLKELDLAGNDALGLPEALVGSVYMDSGEWPALTRKILKHYFARPAGKPKKKR